MKTMKIAIAAAFVSLGLAAPAGADTLATIRDRGELVCGVHTGLVGFGAPDSSGQWQGFDADFCRAFASAILGTPKVKFVPLSDQARFTALQNGEVDVLSRNSTWTLKRDTTLGLQFPVIDFFDGQGLLIRKSLGVSKASELDGATVCIQQGTTSEYVVRNFFSSMKISFKPVVIESGTEFFSAFFANRCDVITSDVSQLSVIRLTSEKPDDYVVLPEIIAKSPLGPVVRGDDKKFADVVKWTVFATFTAEELGIDKANVKEMLKSDSEDVKNLLGVTPGVGQNLGLAEDWVVNVISAVGNYGEIFDRNVGANAPLKMQRGQNALWSKGGLLYSPLF
jgi:general L-amino acid transport system substrate-binding protein